MVLVHTATPILYHLSTFYNQVLNVHRATLLNAAKPRDQQNHHEFCPKLEPLESIYKDFHRNPQLSYWESRTAATPAEHLKSLKFFFFARTLAAMASSTTAQDQPSS
jgi:hypothetical protein